MIGFHFAKVENYNYQPSDCSCNKLPVVTKPIYP